MQITQKISWVACLITLAFSLSTIGSCAPAGQKPKPSPSPLFLLARKGKARAPIIVSATVSASSRASAAMLAKFLQRITGAAFAVQTGDGTSGIVVGTAVEYPALTKSIGLPSLQTGHPLAAQQRYRLRSHTKGVQLIGASELAVEYAVWDFLHRLGFRQFLPGAAWEIVPHLPEAAIAVDTLQEPTYYDRRISTITTDDDVAEWMMRNRLSWHDSPPPSTFRPEMPRRYFQSWINTGHAYSYIVRDHQEVFDKHSEWLALVDGKRGPGTWFCISNPELRAFMAKYAVEYLEKYPEASSVSLEPTDGATPCQCNKCAALAKGKVSNLVVTLSNEAAKAVAARFPNQTKYVGMLGYGYHWQPPDIPVDDRVVVQVTSKTLAPTGGPFPPMAERLAGWAKKARHVGVYEYLSLLDWGGWVPAASAASNLGYMTKVVPQYHQLGARSWLAEASNSWGSSGLGYYLTGRMLWDTKESLRSKEIVDDFLTKSFGPAKEEMREFFAAEDGRYEVSSGSFNQIQARVDMMYPPLLRALQKVSDPVARTRVEHFLLYTRFVDLYARFYRLQRKHELNIEGVTPDAVHRAAVEMVRFANQTRNTHMIPWDMLPLIWFRAYNIQPADLIAPGETEAREIAADDIRRLVDEVTVRYAAAPARLARGGKGPTVRYGDTLLVDAKGFDGLPATDHVAEGVDPTRAQPSTLFNNASRPKDAWIIQMPKGDRDPGPVAGDGYLRLIRQAGNTETNLQARFESRKDGRIVAEWMAHGDPRGDGDHAMHFILGQGNRERVGLITRITGNVFYLHGDEYVDTGLQYDGAKWQQWRFDYEPATGLFDLSIGDATRKGLQGTAGPVDNLAFRCGHNDTTFYVDGAP